MSQISKKSELILWFNEIGKEDTALVGGKCANLGEMITKAKVPVPNGFAITAYAYQNFLEKSNIKDRVFSLLENLDIKDLKELNERTAQIRQLIETADLPFELKEEISSHYKLLSKEQGEIRSLVAVRSSATAEDLPGASFAGQQDTYLNIKGIEELFTNVKNCFASLFTSRAVVYREEKGFDHKKVYLSVAVQKMVNSKASGVMFSLHPVTGNRDVVVIEAAWGLGEYVVQGKINPDEYIVSKNDLKITDKMIADKKIMLSTKQGGGTEERQVPTILQKTSCLTDDQIKELAKYALSLENHYKIAQDMEWAWDSGDNKIYIVQSRPETVWTEKMKEHIFTVKKETREIKQKVEPTKERVKLISGLPASPGIAAGTTHVILDASEASKFSKDEILVTGMTAPDWVPIMKKAAAIVTDSGGMTCHAAIVSRELGIPCVVGTSDGTKLLKTGQYITVDASRGNVYDGFLAELLKVKPTLEKIPLPDRQVVPCIVTEKETPVTGTKVYVNLGVPELANEASKLPIDGVGLMRMEFILATYIGEHPMHLIETGNSEKFIDILADGITKVAEAFSPRPVVLRLSDLKTNEYRELKGGDKYEIHEDNPMLGWRGASRYVDPSYEPALRLELAAIRKVRIEGGLKNLQVMIPFVRTPNELKKVLNIMKEEGLVRSRDFEIWMMCEVPSNIILADQFAKLVNAFSIGSNDLTQLILGCDRDSAKLSKIFDERDEAVLKAIRHFIKIVHKHGSKVSICGQAPSAYTNFTEFLIRNGIDSISVNQDVAIQTKHMVAQIERKILMESALSKQTAFHTNGINNFMESEIL
ncbi:phosphoenolpyruvate synthase [[Eubacterium] cellulosolvens]